jgi:hypothetical protein
VSLNECLKHKIQKGWWKDKTSFRDKLVCGMTKAQLMDFYDIDAYQYREVVVLLLESDQENVAQGAIKNSERLWLTLGQEP